MKIFVNGAVNQVDVYELPKGSRVQDAVEAAGGFSADAYTNNINLAAELNDGMQLFVSTQAEAELLQSQLFITPLQSSQPIVHSSTSSSVEQRININTAMQDELETLPNVGPATAKNIITYREDHGRFEAIEDIMNVTGIGEGKFEDMQGLITVENE